MKILAVLLTIIIMTGFVYAPQPEAKSIVQGEAVKKVVKVEEELKTIKPNAEYLGEWYLTAYCSCSVCCGQWGNDTPGATKVGASGEVLEAGRSAASNVLPEGTVVYIEGYGEVEIVDTMAGWVERKYDGKIIDLYMGDCTHHDELYDFGIQQRKMWRVWR